MRHNGIEEYRIDHDRGPHPSPGGLAKVEGPIGHNFDKVWFRQNVAEANLNNHNGRLNMQAKVIGRMAEIIQRLIVEAEGRGVKFDADLRDVGQSVRYPESI